MVPRGAIRRASCERPTPIEHAIGPITDLVAEAHALTTATAAEKLINRLQDDLLTWRCSRGIFGGHVQLVDPYCGAARGEARILGHPRLKFQATARMQPHL